MVDVCKYSVHPTAVLPLKQGGLGGPAVRRGPGLLIACLLIGSFILVLPAETPESSAIASPSLATILKDFRGTATSKITVGGNVTDSAILLQGAQNAGGTVDYAYYQGNSCGGNPIENPTAANGLEVTVTGGNVPPSRSVTFSSAGLYSWRAAYSGDVNDFGAQSDCESLRVDKMQTVLSLFLSSKAITVRGSASASAILSNFTRTVEGNVTYQYFPGNSCTGSNTTVAVGTKGFASVVGGSASPSNYQQLSRAGNYSWNAVYGGDANDFGAVSPCLKLAVLPQGVTSITNLVAVGGSPLPIKVGGSAYDSVVLVGGTPDAGGTVTYQYFLSASCQGIPKKVGLTQNVTNGVVPHSAAVKFNSTGQYSWNAIYGGDRNNTAATSPCEPLVVRPAAPTLTLTLSSTAVTIGGSVTLSAALTGGYRAGGNVAYSYFFGNSCPSGSPNSLGSPPVTDSLVSGTAWSPVSAGTYTLNAVYSGDGNNTETASPCLSLVVNVQGVQVSTSLRFPVLALGVPETDSAILNGTTPSAGGTVTYQYFHGFSCSGGPQGTSSVAVTNGTVPNSDFVTYTVAGAYSWNAVYSGDAHNHGATSQCEPLTVGHLALTSLGVKCSKSTVTVGSGTTCTAFLTNGLSKLPTGKVTWSTNGTGTFTRTSCTLVKGRCSVTYKPNAAGLTVVLSADYGGDLNNFPAPTGTSLITVVQRKSTISISCTPTSTSVAGSKNAKTITCKAKVTGFGDLTGESVAWTQSGSAFVSFSSSTCSLIKGSCTITIAGDGEAGVVKISASYLGDSNNLPSDVARPVTLTINP